MTRRAISHIYFDLFGTLVNYDPDFTRQNYEVCANVAIGYGIAESNRDFLDRWTQAAGQLEKVAARTLREYSMHDVLLRYLQLCSRAIPEHQQQDVIETYLDDWLAHIDVAPAARRVLDQAREHYTVAVITNTHHAPMVHELLQRLDLAPLLQGVFTSVEFGRRKPHPELFTHALEQLGAQAEHALMVGDSVDADWRGARDAGMHARLLDPRRDADIPEEDRLGCLADLLDQL